MSALPVPPAEPAPNVSSLLERFPPTSPPASAAGAAVLIVLRAHAGEVETLLIERAVRPDDPASGQVGLPGGHVDPADRTLRDTAVRELEEEVGLSATDLSATPRYVSIEDAPRFRLKVGVFASSLAGPLGRPMVPRPEEVAHFFWLPRSRLEAASRVLRDTHQGPREVDAVVYQGRVLWGFTLRVLQQFFA